MCLSIPAKIEKIEGETAVCSVGGSTYQASLMMLQTEELAPGDYVLIHTGFAIQKLDKEEAEASLKAFDEFKKLNEEMDREERETNQRLI
ncbi:HypC/HybG/HupF family hydrogenase formation chaperone [Candidatus Sulfidibacterium hydrothermale]|uniref:HypC/HybG/HupF family hydrogenase formation chaperone n=1 Tax=Candidatus Sulfidibacterium hydrothermale TaxID=2875962 RepID=UPI001F0A6813|nr:HypC/HybG/HupF family hydrogenase formation chaperone [Candidatus Sulfidibacterium hydrothermale]UBM61150.1 HypC/HybG/HupF family hydrogenase formation chaperone [Candidatus Sulfidibacterium hydrothermale]